MQILYDPFNSCFLPVLPCSSLILLSVTDYAAVCTHTHTPLLDAYFHNCFGVIRFLGHSCFKHSSLKIQWPSFLSRGASEIWEWGLESPPSPLPVCVSSPMDLLSPIPSEERTSSFPRLLENVLDLNLLLTSPPLFFLPCCSFLACLFVSLFIPLQTRHFQY